MSSHKPAAETPAVCKDCGTVETEHQREYDLDCECGGIFQRAAAPPAAPQVNVGKFLGDAMAYLNEQIPRDVEAVEILSRAWAQGAKEYYAAPPAAGERQQLKMADDPVYGSVREQICAEYIAAGGPIPKRNWLYSRLIETRVQLDAAQNRIKQLEAERG